MVERNEKVMDMVLEAYRDTPKPDAKALLARAQQMDPSLKGMSVFSFSGRYMGEARNRLSRGNGGGRGKAATGKRASAKKAPSAKKSSSAPAAKKATKAPAAKKRAKAATSQSGNGKARKVSAKKATTRKTASKHPVATKKTTAKKATARKASATKQSARSGGMTASSRKLEGRAREQVRNILVNFGKEITGAQDNPQKLIDVMASVEGHVDRIGAAVS